MSLTNWAEGVRKLVEEDSPEAERITLVMDNGQHPLRRLDNTRRFRRRRRAGC